MAGMRRRLRGLTSRVSGGPPAVPVEVPVEVPAEVPAETPPVVAPEPEPSVPDNGDVSTVTDVTPDPACAAAVDLARAVAVEVGGSSVGEHEGVVVEDALVVSHRFATTDPAYVGWHWTVTVARAEGSDEVTVDEVVLLPGEGALLAPAWVPWSERVQPGDLSPGDLLPPPKDDPRLVPAYTETEAELAAETFWELGLRRPRVLSADGRADAAERWYDGERGPFTPMAKQAPGRCVGCAFLLPLAGGLKALFGVCANAYAPDDGHVVSLDHGCGAHSETPQPTTDPTAGLVVADEELEVVVVGPSPDDETPDGHAS